MEAEQDKIRKHINNKPVSQPSDNFTNLVMEQVQHMAETPLVIKPLISRTGWIYIIIVSTLAIFGSFILEFVGSVQKMSPLFNMSDLHLEDFMTSIKVAIGVTSLLLLLTLVDIIYRKMKQIA